MRSSRQHLILGALAAASCAPSRTPPKSAPLPAAGRAVADDVGRRPISPDVGVAPDEATSASWGKRCLHAPYVETLRLKRARVRVGETVRASVVAGIDGPDVISLSVDPAAGLRVGDLVVDEVEAPRGLDEVTVRRWQRYTFSLTAMSAGQYSVKLAGPCFDDVAPKMLTVR